VYTQQGSDRPLWQAAQLSLPFTTVPSASKPIRPVVRRAYRRRRRSRGSALDQKSIEFPIRQPDPTPRPQRSEPVGVEPGSIVTVRLLHREGALRLRLSSTDDNPERGVIKTTCPLAQAILGSLPGDEFHYTASGKVRGGFLVKIERPGAFLA
jgi:hypothetical protein